jgi:hypothetical protein
MRIFREFAATMSASRTPQFRELLHEHLVKRIDHRTFDDPMKVVRLQIKNVAVGEWAREALRNLPAAFFVDSNFDVHGRLLLFRYDRKYAPLQRRFQDSGPGERRAL